MGKFRLHDWNDVRLIIACADHGGFAGAGAALGLDQTTVSRRVGDLEKAAGRPLFHRRRSGATPTAAGAALLQRARAAWQAMAEFEATLGGLTELPPPTVTVGASEGLLTYTLIPALLGSSATPQPIDAALIRQPLPTLGFTTRLAEADIAIAATSAEEVPSVRGAVRVRRIGTMHFKPVTGQALLLAEGRSFDSFDHMADRPLLDIAIYRPIRSLDDWNALTVQADSANVITTQTSLAMHQALVEGQGVGILPSYSPLYDERIVAFDFRHPPLRASLWLVAHEDKLREPAVRALYDTLAGLFLASPWFRDRA